jgi:UDP-hydrolysing UDP-N-acetyl-D-glucosamine 2-epimerase
VKKVLVLLTNRANWGRLKPVMQAIRNHPDLQLQVACTGSMLLDRFKHVAHEVRADGFTVDMEFLCELEGSTPYAQAASACLAGYNFATTLYQLDPDCLLVIGDRYETGACCYAAHQMNIPICHLQGGEVSGTRDDGTRNMITQLATWHVPATRMAARQIATSTCIGLFGKVMCDLPHNAPFLAIGCPSSDLAAKIRPRFPIGDILACYHPNTDHPETARNEAEQFCEAIQTLAVDGKRVVLLWPNIDAGSGDIVKEMRWINHPRIELHKNFPPDEFMQRLADCAVAVGNSSSFCRDSSFFGTPVVLAGDRQQGREHASNVMEAKCRATDILAAVDAQLLHGRYEPSTLYGDGKVSERIAEGLARVLNAKREVAV